MRYFSYPSSVAVTCALILSSLLSTSLSQAQERLPRPFSANYQAKIGAFSVNGERSLAHIDGQHWQLQLKAKNFLASIHEQSTFNWQGQTLSPQHYQYSREGLGRNRYARLNFDWEALKVNNDVQDETWNMAIEPGSQDKLSYQLQLRRDLLNGLTQFHYPIADGGRLKHYQFKILSEEVLDTPVGPLNTIKLERLRDDNKNRRTLLWFAKDYDYLMVKLEHREIDGKSHHMLLKSANIEGYQPLNSRAHEQSSADTDKLPFDEDI